jgi:hypothetical protein
VLGRSFFTVTELGGIGMSRRMSVPVSLRIFRW